jgi:hypothetical protein
MDKSMYPKNPQNATLQSTKELDRSREFTWDVLAEKTDYDAAVRPVLLGEYTRLDLGGELFAVSVAMRRPISDRAKGDAVSSEIESYVVGASDAIASIVLTGKHDDCAQLLLALIRDGKLTPICQDAFRYIKGEGIDECQIVVRLRSRAGVRTA